jgi:hypothetical protein
MSDGFVKYIKKKEQLSLRPKNIVVLYLTYVFLTIVSIFILVDRNKKRRLDKMNDVKSIHDINYFESGLFSDSLFFILVEIDLKKRRSDKTNYAKSIHDINYFQTGLFTDALFFTLIFI